MPVWKYGKRLPASQEAVCKKCKKVVPAKQSNTSNLINHIMNMHTDSETAKKLSDDLAKRKDIRKQKMLRETPKERKMDLF